MVRRLEAILSLLAVVLLSASVDASDWAQLPTKKQALDAATRAKAVLRSPSAKPRHYTNAKFGFTMTVPPGAEVAEREGTNQISVRSRKGYVINVQVGPKRPDIPLARMSTLLEPKYLGEGKPWSTRVKEWSMEVAGLTAYNVVYRGTSSKARVVVARGKVNDYVFIFIASSILPYVTAYPDDITFFDQFMVIFVCIRKITLGIFYEISFDRTEIL